MGHMSHILSMSVKKVATEGPELVFIVYPQIFANLPASPVWSVLFFVMLVCLGIDSQVSYLLLVFIGSPSLRSFRIPGPCVS